MSYATATSRWLHPACVPTPCFAPFHDYPTFQASIHTVNDTPAVWSPGSNPILASTYTCLNLTSADVYQSERASGPTHAACGPSQPVTSFASVAMTAPTPLTPAPLPPPAVPPVSRRHASIAMPVRHSPWLLQRPLLQAGRKSVAPRALGEFTYPRSSSLSLRCRLTGPHALDVSAPEDAP